jgi:hypothetical protein
LSKEQPGAADPLYRAIPERRTNHYSYDRSRQLDPGWMDSARPLGEGVRVILLADDAGRDQLEAAVIGPTLAIIVDERMIADSDRWFKTSRAEIDEHRDGPTLEASGLSFLALSYTRFIPVSARTSHDASPSQTRHTQVGSAPVGLIAVRDR